MKAFAISLVALTAFSFSAFAGENSQAQAPAKVQAVAVKGAVCDCQVVEVARRPLFGRRAASSCCETVMVPATKTVTTYEKKTVMVPKEVLVATKKEVPTLVPAKVVASSCCAPVTAVVAPVRRLGGRLRGATASVVDCVTCK